MLFFCFAVVLFPGRRTYIASTYVPIRYDSIRYESIPIPMHASACTHIYIDAFLLECYHLGSDRAARRARWCCLL